VWIAKATLDTLPYAEGASWNPNLVCLGDTRKALVEDIIAWIHSADESKAAEIFWLSDVAGAGKTAIAHTIAQYCDSHGLLGSSFFFDRNIPDRRTPHKLFSTIVRDLAGLDSGLADQIGTILQNDRSLASACQTRQFDKLIFEPSLTHPIGRPVVIVIDALDEGHDLETLEVLRNMIPKLSGTFRIFLTSRPLHNIVTDLSNVGHVRHRSLDIHGDTNQRDIGVYTRNRLDYISSRRQLPVDWPGTERAHALIAKAEGLFVWVSIVSGYLSTVAHPDRKLSTLLYERNLSGMSAEAKMDALYTEILNGCDWSDEDVVNDYHSFMGAVITVKTPLSSSALRSLYRSHPRLDINGGLHPLGSLLTGLFNNHQPIQILHLSFREFLTSRTQFSMEHRHFHINEQDHNQQLAILCLHILNEDLSSNTPGAGYLSGMMPDIEGIPLVDKSQVSEVVWYVCQFWTDHITEIEGPVSQALVDSLWKFLTNKVMVWMEVLNTQYPFQTLSQVRKWLQVSV
jgi:hypothetical protein